MRGARVLTLLSLALLLLAAACTSQPAPQPTQAPPALATALPLTAVPTAAPTAAPTTAPTAPPAPTAAPTTAATVPPTGAPTGASTSAPAAAGISGSDAEKVVADKFNKVDRNLALWNIQPGLGTVMIEYGNRLARMWFAANAGNWDMAKYQLDEMIEIQEVGETTRPTRSPMLKAFEDAYLKKIDTAIGAKDKTAFTQAFNDAVGGCNQCHTASTGSTWKSYKYVDVQTPKTDPAPYVDWKGGGQDSYIANPPAAATAAPATPPATMDAAAVLDYVNSKFNKVDRSQALWNIQPGLGTVMIEYGNRFGRLFYSAKAGNWDMAKYQLDEMKEIQEVGETTRPSRTPMLKAFESAYLDKLDAAIQAKDSTAFDAAYTNAIDGCNTCHTASTGSNWKSYKYVKIQAPTADSNDYIVANAAKGTGSYIANPPAAPTATAAPAPSGTLDQAGVEKLLNDKFNTVDRSLALWNIQPGLGTVMIEYGRRFAQLKAALDAGNLDMAKYQLDEMIEIQEVGETTRPSRSPMLKAFEEAYLKPIDVAIMAGDKAKAQTALQNAVSGCNACHAGSKSANWSSYAYVQVQLPKTDPADYLKWQAPGGTGNYATPAPAGATPAAGGGTAAPTASAGSAATAPAATAAATGAPATSAPAGGPPKLSAAHAGRTQCLVCHTSGAGGAPKLPTANPDHTAFKDDNNAALCLGCHQMAQ